MKEEKFKVIQFVKEFIIDIEKELENIELYLNRL